MRNLGMNEMGLIALYKQAFETNSDLPLFSDYGGISYTYHDAARLIYQIHGFLEQCQIEEGDKVALLGRNSAHWAISFLAVVSYGAVAVPILPDFNPADVHHIVRHSESKILFAGEQLLEKLSLEEMPALKAVLSLQRMDPIWAESAQILNFWRLPVPGRPPFSNELFMPRELADEHICMISYTSGTSGFTKGVMLPVRSLTSNIRFARERLPLKQGDQMVSFLPMAHVFGLLFEFLFPATSGCHITFLTKPPTPQVIVKAFKEIRPHLILSVPLIIEKIYNKQIQPALEKPLMSFLLKVPGIRGLLYKKVRQKLTDTFGGRFYEIVIGGAALNREVEDFFRTIKFPFTIGYGMTECGPLISYQGWNKTRPHSAGVLVDRMQLKIDSADPFTQVGEIMVKGDHVMAGYYKNPEATAQAIDQDGWLRTGDLGVTDANNFIYIRGRSKNMLLGPSGQNIYPEEIEAKLSSCHFILESVLVERDAKLVALVYPDHESLDIHHQDKANEIARLMEEYRLAVNKELPKYSQISRMELVETEFEKTPKRNIKRYLYT
ncbi:AMP-binding protein [Mangrovibacterium marinum]|uniref:Long-chain acyl-CoA synthetase n=1 Tax=Mangrovibacterium marinum TaxID=1639118 RepID=A0A2T5C6H8_9BACT|nr:AMP-binding protein [Mangrovibacterium marinum]PTN10557.1 long-chain acyl-CoA synthetase [Mangrovibacterium marinum]